ncbi:histamine H2 receptor [Pelobates cultripes]|uniref:Histamine H2 receptor n=2 Tax=Pelobates cultripes TaxID=61616 RepID=A0AAD1RU64_PELCU|nr:histamine H2 receptor [Pelobates cultripes]
MCSSVMGDDLQDSMATCWRTIVYNVLIGVVLVLIIIMTICGNVVVCLAVGFDRRLRSMTNCFIVSLAITDLLLGILVLPFSALNLLQEEWPFGATFCNIYTSLDVMLCTASILNLFMISLDRYYGVTAPLQYSIFVTPGRVAIAMGVIWVVSLMVSFLPIHLGWNTKDKTIQNSRDDDNKECTFELNKEYVLVDGLLTFYLPLFIMCLMYYRIFKIAREQAKRINHTNCSNAVSPTLPTVREHKATVTLAAVMGAFIICWFPYFTVFTYQGVNDTEVDETAFLIVLWLGYANSALNPILYAALNRDFRTAYQRLLHCRRVGPLSHETPLTLLHIRRSGERTPQEMQNIPEEKSQKIQETNGKEGSPFIRNTAERDQPRLCNKCVDVMSCRRGLWLLNFFPKQSIRTSVFKDTSAETPDGIQMPKSGIVLSSSHFPDTIFSEYT